ncbi:MAG: hypothetical protein ACMG6E_08660, partial [Candidatus Roizmanbacteria bacterium]
MIKKRFILLIIAILVVLIVIKILLDIRYCKKINKPTVTFDSIKDKLKTGDVIVMHSSSFVKGKLMKAYLGCDASHIAMIIRREETDVSSNPNNPVVSSKSFQKDRSQKHIGIPEESLFVIELGPYGMHPLRKSDVRIRPLSDVLKKSKHRVFGLVPCAKEISFTAEDEEKYLNYRYNYFVPTMFSPYKKYKVCSNFVSMIHH